MKLKNTVTTRNDIIAGNGRIKKLTCLSYGYDFRDDALGYVAGLTGDSSWILINLINHQFSCLKTMICRLI